MDIADPASENYGKHWTAGQVMDAFKPRLESEPDTIVSNSGPGY